MTQPGFIGAEKETSSGCTRRVLDLFDGCVVDARIFQCNTCLRQFSVVRKAQLAAQLVKAEPAPFALSVCISGKSPR